MFSDVEGSHWPGPLRSPCLSLDLLWSPKVLQNSLFWSSVDYASTIWEDGQFWPSAEQSGIARNSELLDVVVPSHCPQA